MICLRELGCNVYWSSHERRAVCFCYNSLVGLGAVALVVVGESVLRQHIADALCINPFITVWRLSL